MEAVAPRIGTDLVRVADIAESVSCFGSRYLRRIFTPRELHDSTDPGRGFDLERLAARFAAKEAVVKVLRPVWHWFNWQQIEILRSDGGWATLELHGAAKAHAGRERLARFSISLSHEQGYAIAVALATG